MIATGLWGGHTGPERHANEIRHLDDCSGKTVYGQKCRGCRLAEERIALLEARFREMAPRFPTAAEAVV